MYSRSYLAVRAASHAGRVCHRTPSGPSTSCVASSRVRERPLETASMLTTSNHLRGGRRLPAFVVLSYRCPLRGRADPPRLRPREGRHPFAALVLLQHGTSPVDGRPSEHLFAALYMKLFALSWAHRRIRYARGGRERGLALDCVVFWDFLVMPRMVPPGPDARRDRTWRDQIDDRTAREKQLMRMP